MEGKKDIVGLYLSESEGANFWLSVDLNNRGLQDILIVSVDGLSSSFKRGSRRCSFSFR